MRCVPRALAVIIAVAAAAPAVALGVCVEGTYPPFSETQPDGTITGFDIDIANALCARIGESCDFVRTDWARMIPSLVAGGCDAIIASMSDTPERRAYIDFTDRYYRARCASSAPPPPASATARRRWRASSSACSAAR